MVEEIVQIAHNQQFLDKITKGEQGGGNLELLKKLPTYDKLVELERSLNNKHLLTFNVIFHEPVGNYLIKTFLVTEHSVDKAIFVSDVELFKKLNDPSARNWVAKKIFARFLANETSDHIQGVSVFSKPDDNSPWYAQRKSVIYDKGFENDFKTDNNNNKLNYEHSAASFHSGQRQSKYSKHLDVDINDESIKHNQSISHLSEQQFSLSKSMQTTHNTLQNSGNHNSILLMSQNSEGFHLNTINSSDNILNNNNNNNNNNNDLPNNINNNNNSNNLKYGRSLSLMTEFSNTIGVYGKPIKNVYKLIQNGKTNDPKLFDIILHEVLNDLRLDVFPRFCNSIYYKTYIRCKAMENKKVTIKDFQPLRPLGRGAFGLVHACEKIDCGKLYAMKQINKKRVQATDSLKTVMQERNYLAMMNSNFVTTLKYGIIDDTTIHIILDLMLGGDLKYHLNVNEKFTEDRARFHAAQVLLGLQHIHSKNIVYRDLKLENILLDQHGHCKVSDLGLAVLLTPSKDKVRGYAGTPGYTAPEVVLGFEYDYVVDFFSLGVMIYRCLCGRKPFERKRGRNQRHKDKRHRKSSALDRNVIEMEPEFPPHYFSSKARSILKGLMAKNPLTRLGYNGISEIKQHPWFDQIDFGLLEAGYLQPPFDAPKLEQVHSPIGGNDEAPPLDDQYRHIKITQEFEKQLIDFEFVSKETLQEELVEVLKNSDIKKIKNGYTNGINKVDQSNDTPYDIPQPKPNKCFGCNIL